MSNKARITAAALFLLIGVGVFVAVVIRATDDGSPNDGPDQQAGTTRDDGIGDATPPAPIDDAEVLLPAEAAMRPFEGWPPTIGVRPVVLGDFGTPPPTTTEAEPGLYLWSDFHGWHLWAVGTQEPMTGRITVDGELGPVSSEGTALAQHSLDPGGKAFTFELHPATGIAGLRFNPGFFTKSISIAVDGDAPPLRTGWTMVEAPVPVTITKGVPVPTP